MENRILDYEAQPTSRTPPGASPEEPFDPTGREVDWQQVIQDYIAANPGVCLGAALLAGVYLGWLIKRR